jgi:potassium/chloride transporter 4/5/6
MCKTKFKKFEKFSIQIFHRTESSMRKMHSAVRLNQQIQERSRDAKLVLINLPSPPPKQSSLAAYSYMEYVDVLTEGLDRLLLMRGSGREVITIFS